MGHRGSRWAFAGAACETAPSDVTAPRSMPRRRSPGALAWLASAFLLLALAARTHAAPANDACLMCHHVQDLARNAGLKGSLSVDARTFEASAHGALACQRAVRSEEHKSELQSPYVIMYPVFCLK